MRKHIFLLLALILCINCTCSREQGIKIKIMSYNIRHGEGMDGELDLSRAAEIIRMQSPDLCGLQEIDNFCLRSDSLGQTAYLAAETRMTGTFGKFMDYQGGEYGMATLSSKPLLSTKVLQLPDGIYEPRTSIVHKVQVAEACTLVFANVHFDWINGEQGSASRLGQAKALLQYVDTLKHAIIITGDFNCTPGSPTMQYFFDQGFCFADKGEDNLSFQGGRKSEIDHLIFRNSSTQTIIIRSTELIDEPLASDHRPLVTELEVHY